MIPNLCRCLAPVPVLPLYGMANYYREHFAHDALLYVIANARTRTSRNQNLADLRKEMLLSA